MKILVVSDSHRFDDDLIRVVNKYKNHVDLMVHCGDSSLPIDDPLINEFDIVVQGNHDIEPFPHFVAQDGILVTHGHYYNVYSGYSDLIQLCQQQHATICLHGHTHVPTHQVHEGIHFINPGSLMMNRGSYGFGTYAIVETQPFEVHFYHHENDTQCDDILEEGLDLLEEFKEIVKNYEKSKNKA